MDATALNEEMIESMFTYEFITDRELEIIHISFASWNKQKDN